MGGGYASFSPFKDYVHMAAGALDKQGNPSLIKISLISLLIKRAGLVMECLWPSSPLPLLVVSFLFSFPLLLLLCGVEDEQRSSLKETFQLVLVRGDAARPVGVTVSPCHLCRDNTGYGLNSQS